MVAISLYRGNLHKVPDIPRRWLMPSRKISLKDFKSLLNRRSKALSRLRSSAAAAVATTSCQNPNPSAKAIDAVVEASPLETTNPEEKVKNRGDVYNSSEKGDKAVTNHDDNLQAENLELQDKRNDEAICKADVAVDDEKEKRKKEVGEKLQVLNRKKHSLVQVLKQILNVEEELKRRNNAQVMATTCSSLPLQVDVTNDSGSMSRLATPRMGSEPNLGVDTTEGGDTDDVSNHNNSNANTNTNNHSRHIKRMSSTSTSPSSESPARKLPFIQHNVVLHPSRPSMGVTSSPSRFAPGHQGPPANVPSVSVSGTNYIASSPSPAASGGTSAFRDARLPSPWN